VAWIQSTNIHVTEFYGSLKWYKTTLFIKQH